MELRLLISKWGDYHGLTGWSQRHLKVEEEAGESEGGVPGEQSKRYNVAGF